MADTYPYDLGPYARGDARGAWATRGLLWGYAYNHEEAVRCYKQALAHHADDAFAAWGIAYCVGPNYNKPWVMFEDAERAACMAIAYEHAQRAASLVAKGDNSLTAALVDAIQVRYPTPTPKPDMSDYDLAYAEKMEEVYAAHPDDLDAIALFAEAVMGLRPWALWNTTTGEPAFDWTLKAMRALERGLALAKERGIVHPGLCHFYIHGMELSKTPGKALEASELLETACPDAGHLIHMPSHIYIQVGMYDEAVRSNAAAVAADNKYLEDPTPGRGVANFYSVYRFHDAHFLAWAAMFQGSYATALKAALDMNATVPEACLTEPWQDAVLGIERPPMADWFEAFMATYLHVKIRFGRWQELLDEHEAPWERVDARTGTKVFTSVLATLAYAKGVAAAALSGAAAAGSDAQRGLLKTARGEYTKFMESVAYLKAHTPDRTVMNNKVVVQMEVAEAVLRGELLFREGDVDGGLADLERAVVLYDGGEDADTGLVYDEPWGWMMPTRHILGALATEAGRYDLAERAYLEDLGLTPPPVLHPHYPNNVWALRGLVALRKRTGAPVDASLAEQLAKASAKADRNIHASCMCQVVAPEGRSDAAA